ncbi:MAG: HAD family phosphatase [Prevotellaceae bacterium]|jgi:2-haloacid dehalogenase|nr:HAD family phosphatase [Prevotellaceae bacterium]
MHSSLKSIIFDFGNVLIEWDPRRIFRDMVPAEELENFMQNVWKDEWNNSLDSGVSLADNEQSMKAKYPQHSRYIAAYHARWYESLGDENVESVALLTQLQNAGYATYGLSNWSAETFPIVRKAHPFFNSFDGIVLSGEEKVCKPTPQIYAILLERYKLHPAQCAFIDDRQENLDAAKEMGITPILFTSAAQAREALKRLGVL